MKLNRIAISGVNGRTAAHDVKPITVYYGPNGAGKTTQLTAVKAGLKADSGFVPDGADVAISLGFDGATVRRTLAPKHSVSVESASGTTAGIKACASWISEHIGAPVDLSGFLRASPGERETKLLGLSRSLPEGLPATAADVAKALGEAAVSVLAVGNPAAKKPEERPLTVPAAWEARDVGAVCEWIGLALPRLRSAKMLKERDTKSNERAAAELSAVESAPDGTLSEAKERVGRLQVELGTARGQLMACEALGGSVGDALVRLQEKETQLATLRARAKAYPAAADLTPIEAEESDLRAQLAALHEAQDAERNADMAVRTVRDVLQRAESAHRDACRAAVEAERTAQSYQTGSECPTCGRPLTAECRGGPEAAAAFTAALERVTACEADLSSARQAESEANAALIAARDRSNAAIEASEPVLAQLDVLAQRKTEATAKWHADKATLTAEGKALAAAVDDAKRALSGLPMGVDPDLLRAQVEGLEADLSDAQKATDAQQRAAARNEERARLRRVMAEYREQIKALGSAVTLLESWRSRIVTGAAEKLAAAANEIGALVFPGARFLTVSTDAGTELRLRVPEMDGQNHPTGGTVDIPVPAWQDSAILVFSVACTIALAESEGWKWRAVLVDEVQRLDPERFRGFIAAMAALVKAGRLDNVLIAGALSAEHLALRIPSGWTREEFKAVFRAVNLGTAPAVKAVAA